MNTQLLRKFSREILSGARSLGVATDHLRDATLSADQAAVLETQTGRAIGELVVLGMQHDASPEQNKRHGELLRDTTELMACLDSALRPASTSAVRKTAIR